MLNIILFIFLILLGVIKNDIFRFRLPKAQLEIQQQEENSPFVQSEVKPFTTKAPVHVIEALDTVAEEFGMSRNAFVLKLLEFYLGFGLCRLSKWLWYSIQ